MDLKDFTPHDSTPYARLLEQDRYAAYRDRKDWLRGEPLTAAPQHHWRRENGLEEFR